MTMLAPATEEDALAALRQCRADRPGLAVGRGEGPGDCAQAGGELTLSLARLNRVLRFDPQARTITVQAGVVMSDLLALVASQGFWPEVTPPFPRLSVGGAIAANAPGVQGAGWAGFGAAIEALALARTDGEVYHLKAAQAHPLFDATLGGLGLTGLILWATVRLRPIESAFCEVEAAPCDDVGEAMAFLDAPRSGRWARSARLHPRHDGAGVLVQSRFCDDGGFAAPRRGAAAWEANRVSVLAPAVLQRLQTLRLTTPEPRKRLRYERVVFAEDIGPLGLSVTAQPRDPRWLRVQCALPSTDAAYALREILTLLRDADSVASPLFLGRYCAPHSPSALRSPDDDVLLRLDLRGAPASVQTDARKLDALIHSAGGRLDPACDTRMTADVFQTRFAGWRRLAEAVDPGLSSQFWLRAGGARGGPSTRFG